MDFSIKYTSKILEQQLVQMRNMFNFISLQTLGNSVMGRKIWCVKIGNGKRKVFYSASIHANESITTNVLMKFIYDYAMAYSNGDDLTYNVYGNSGSADRAEFVNNLNLAENISTLEQIVSERKSMRVDDVCVSKQSENIRKQKENTRQVENISASELMKNTTLYVCPLVNPDGVDLVNGYYEAESKAYKKAKSIAEKFPKISFPSGWKSNLNGVDLNLQFPAGWIEARQIKYNLGFDKPAPRDFVGYGPLTEPEALALYNFTLINNFDLILAYHTQGEVIYWKYQNYNPTGAKELGEQFAKTSGYLLADTPYNSSFAGYKDWFIEKYNRSGYTIEAGKGTNPLGLEQFEDMYNKNIGILVQGLESQN